jgi:hypothetical protein
MSDEIAATAEIQIKQIRAKKAELYEQRNEIVREIERLSSAESALIQVLTRTSHGTNAIIREYVSMLKPGDRIDLDKLVDYALSRGWRTSTTDYRGTIVGRLSRFGPPIVHGRNRAEYFYQPIVTRKSR